MTLRQEAIMKISYISDSDVRYVIALMDEMLRQAKVDIPVVNENSENDSKFDAFQAIMAFRRTHPTPKQIDIEKIKMEAIEKKYGPFN